MAWSTSADSPVPPCSSSGDQLLPSRRPTSPLGESAPLSPQSASHVDAFSMVPVSSLPRASPTLAPPTNQRSGVGATNRLFGIFFLIVCTCGIGLVSVGSLLLGSDSHGGRSSVTTLALSTQLQVENTPSIRRGAAADDANANNGNQIPTTPTNLDLTTFPKKKLSVAERWQRLGDLDEYECVAWRPCKDCSPYAEVEANKSAPCNATIANGVAGFCEIRHKSNRNRVQHVMEMFCDSLRPAVEFKCEDFASILTYGKRATAYEHDASFSFGKTRQDFRSDQKQLVALPLEVSSQPDRFFRRGIAIVVYEKLLESVFASIKSLRQLGCELPIELWYIKEETNVQHPLLKVLTTQYGAYLREITDPRASRFYTKIYAVFYSAFDQVLLLDADNFAVRDPTYLFQSEQFSSTGAIFWPDFWRFKKTIFNIQPTSLVWDVFDLDPVDMFEQESGQVLVDRRRHLKAMNVMMYYAFHPRLLESMRLVWGDKDLFRFAWMKTQSSFHMIEMPPGSAGMKLPDKNVFCGVTMVQHDTNHEVLFLHRNQEKLTSENRRTVWNDLQQFKLGQVPLDDYDVRGANGGRYYPMYKRCYGKDIYYEKAFVVTPVAQLPFAGLESRLLDYIHEAARIAKGSTAASIDAKQVAA